MFVIARSCLTAYFRILDGCTHRQALDTLIVPRVRIQFIFYSEDLVAYHGVCCPRILALVPCMNRLPSVSFLYKGSI